MYFKFNGTDILGNISSRVNLRFLWRYLNGQSDPKMRDKGWSAVAKPYDPDFWRHAEEMFGNTIVKRTFAVLSLKISTAYCDVANNL